jgi:serine/threonine protein kinase
VTQRDSGSVLDGKYEILERLATGGMGEVWRARHLHLQELRVIKILRADRATDPHALQRFAQEARIATQIKHPNVAILYDFSRMEDGSFYMVWEHIDGEDVGHWLKSKGPFPVVLAVELGIQALRGLEAIHAAGVIHRDLSPDNLMIARDRRGRHQVKIIDLGLAKNLAVTSGLEITQAGMFMGKLAYCSPEQAGSIKDAPLDHRSDVYSLAAVLYEMVTGRLPYDSESQHGYVFKRLTEAPIPMVGRVEGIAVPPELDTVIQKGLARDRERRWPDALSFLHALVRIADQLRHVATQEIAVSRPAAASAVPVAPNTDAAARGGSRPGSSELSREERNELLAQIDRAAKRVNEATRLFDLASQALREGRRADAAAIVAQIESVSPRHPGLAELKAQVAGRPAVPVAPVAAAPAAAAAPAPVPLAKPAPAKAAAPARPAAPDPRQAQIAEAERLLEKYLREHKRSLAEFALSTLLELAPNHPRRGDYESWVRLIEEEVQRLKRCEAAVDEGRQALARGDLKLARQRLDFVEKNDPSNHLTESFAAEIEAQERQSRSDADLERRRDRLEELLDSRRLADAERELERLSSAGLARVSVETYRLRISDIAALAERDARATEYEKRYREKVAERDWMAARDVVIEFERAVPDSPRAAQLYAEISRLEEIHRKRQGIEQGTRQVESFLAQRKTPEAELALKILLQMDPEHPQRAQLEQKVRALRSGA